MNSTWIISVVSEVRRGEWCEDYYRTVTLWGVTAHNEAGRRFAYVGPVDCSTEHQAEALADRIWTHFRNNPTWTPVDNKHWVEGDPVYGSEEYESQGIEGQWAVRERTDDPWFYEDAVKNSYMA